MKPVKNISLIYECDQATLQRAVTLAKDRGARLTIVYPIKDIPGGQARLTLGRKSIDVRNLVSQQEKARLKQFAESARALGVRPATRLLMGEPFLEIIR